MPDIDIPNRVANQSFLSQTGNVGTTTLFTPASAGNFRLSFYGELFTGSTATVSVTLAWTDDQGAQTLVLTLSNPGGYAHDTVYVHVASGSITIAASQSGGSTYSLYAAVEQM